MIALRKVTQDTALQVGTTSTLIAADNPRRKWLTVVNASDTDMWMRLGSAAEVEKGVYISSGGFGYEISADNLWTGPIYAIHAGSGTKPLSILELE